MRTTFVVGKLTPKSTEIVVAESRRSPAPIPGPWTLRAVVRPSYRPVSLAPDRQNIH